MDLSGLEPLEVKVQPAYNQIGGLKLSNNTFDAKFSLSIFSVDSEEKSKGAITVYEYNSDKHTVDSKVYGINAEDLNKTEYEVKLEDYTVHEGHFLEDGSHIDRKSTRLNSSHVRI